MFCTSLRKRPGWSPLVPLLVGSKSMKWAEKNLGGSHDIAFPIQRDQANRIFRVVLMSPKDLESPEGSKKPERASLLGGGTDVAIFFLLSSSKKSQGKEEVRPGNESVEAFLRLQIETAELEIPLLPVSSLAELPEALASFRQTLTRGPSEETETKLASSLLAGCVYGKPLVEKNKKILADLTDSMADLAHRVSTEKGQDELRGLLGRHDGNRVIDYFAREVTLR